MRVEHTDGKPASAACPKCGAAMRPALVKTAIWREERLFVVEDIPAQVCDRCLEQFYDEQTSDTLRRLTEESFSSLRPAKKVLVPIFSLPAAAARTKPASGARGPAAPRTGGSRQRPARTGAAGRGGASSAARGK